MSDDPAERPDDTATRIFARHRELLFSVVHSMTGSVSDAEDILRDTWLAWVLDSRRHADGGARTDDGSGHEDPCAWLLRTAVGRALARQSGTGLRPTNSPGLQAQEPPAGDPPAEAGARKPFAGRNARPEPPAEPASMALLVVMETLPPLERAVFVLTEVFGYPHAEVARILGSRPGTVRQLAHRAREHVRARRPRRPAGTPLRQRLTERFIAAATTGDVAALLELLAPDVTMWTDGGGTVRSALRPVSGRERVAGFLAGYAASHPPQRQDLRYRHVIGDPSAVVFSGDSPYAVLVMDFSAPGDQVTGIHLVTNPGRPSRAASHPDPLRNP